MPDRIFYEKGNWFAFLASVPHTKGHTILAACNTGAGCPQQMGRNVLAGLDVALHEVSQAIRRCYEPEPKNILLASLRGDEAHFHIHLVPLWSEEEDDWRKVTGYPDAHLMEYLGALEKRHDFKVLLCESQGMEEEKQRIEYMNTKRMSEEIKKLREITEFHTSEGCY